MDRGKGKGPAEGESEADIAQPGKQPSLISRVAASARGLTRSTFAIPDSNDLSERAAAALREKPSGGQSSNSGSSLAESSQVPPKVHRASSVSGFRTGHNEDHVRQSENQFSSFLDGIDSFTPSEESGHGHFASGRLEDDFEGSWRRAQYPRSPPTQNHIYGSIAEQRNQDGEDVLVILSQKGNMDDTFEPSPEDENYNWGLSAEQLQQLRAMTMDLFPPVQMYGTVHPDHPLNLNPDFEHIPGHSSLGDQGWREQWDGVLNRYTDEVWGDLLPLVKEARKEVEDRRSDSSSTKEPKALRRLGAILRHLRKIE